LSGGIAMFPASKDAPRKPFKSSSRKFFAKLGEARKSLNLSQEQSIFGQGDVADAVFYIRKGKVKLTIASKAGKEVILGILGEGDFFGEAALAGHTVRMGSAFAVTDCEILRIEKGVMIAALRRERAFSNVFVACLLARNIRFAQHLAEQLFSSGENKAVESSFEKEAGCNL
jgi:CRP/FNR family transcriptional regulator, cyclic AMP receptor protein